MSGSIPLYTVCVNHLCTTYRKSEIINLVVDQIQLSTKMKSEEHLWFHRSTIACPWSANPVSSVVSPNETPLRDKRGNEKMLILPLTWLNDFPCLWDLRYEGTAVLHFIHKLLVAVDLGPNSKGNLVNQSKLIKDLCQFVSLSVFNLSVLPQCSNTLSASQLFIDISLDFI